MPALQTTYGATIAPAFEGMIANSTDQTVLSKQVESAAGLGFGKVVVQGVADDQVRVSEVTRRFMGISVASHVEGGESYAQYATAPILIQGEIWVLAGATVVAGDAAYYVPATGVLTNVATSNTAIPGGFFTSSGASGSLVKIRFDVNA